MKSFFKKFDLINFFFNNNIDIGFDDTQKFQVKRLLQLFWLSELVFLISFINSILANNFLESSIKGITIFSLFFVFILLKKGKIIYSSSLMLWILTFSISYLVWIDAGLRDSGLLAFSGILIFAVILGLKKNFFTILVYMLTFIGVMGHANITGWYIHNVVPVTINLVSDLILVFFGIGISIWLLANDLQILLNKLIIENNKVMESNAKIEHLVNYDILTGLPNRILSKDRFEQAYAHIKRYSGKIAVICLDIDNFKTINDSLGHIIGDELIKGVAKRIRKSIRETDTVSRQGGDEFLIILESLKDQDIVSEIIMKILNQLTIPFNLNSNEYVCTCSIGISISPDDGIEFDTLIKKADLAMYKVKETGKNGFMFYDQKMNQDIQDHLHLLTQMRVAIQEKQFCIYYQPKIDLQNSKLIGAEALIRWKHPERGMISPASFIPLAESSGLIVEIGEWVVLEACKQCKEWHDLGYKNLDIAVNVSPVQFKRGNFEEVVRKALEKSNLPPSHLEIELTESLLIDDSNVLKEMLIRLHNIGVKFSIDDFGTGYSNLGYLKKFKVEVLKIDQSFISKIIESPQDEAIVKAILQMAKSLGLKTVAEGIENEKTFKKLKDLKCFYAQGFLWSKPLPANEFLEFIRKKK